MLSLFSMSLNRLIVRFPIHRLIKRFPKSSAPEIYFPTQIRLICSTATLSKKPKNPSFPTRAEAEEELEEEDEESSSSPKQDEEDDDFPKEYRTLEVNSVSLRADVVSKNVFNISRSKAEDLIMAMKIRINGNKIKDRAAEVKNGDTLDMFLNVNEDNPKNADISRVQLLSMSYNQSSKSFKLKINRWKKMIVDDFKIY